MDEEPGAGDHHGEQGDGGSGCVSVSFALSFDVFDLVVDDPFGLSNEFPEGMAPVLGFAGGFWFHGWGFGGLGLRVLRLACVISRASWGVRRRGFL